MPLLEFDAQLQYPSGFRLDACFTTEAPVTGLFGPSGSGKSSILSIIAGLRRPASGRISLRGRVLFDSKQRLDVRPEHRRVGYVFQDHLLFPHLTVRKNLLYGSRRQKPDAIRNGPAPSFSRTMEVLELGGMLERSPHTLSGGERQRVALGRALLANPQLLLLDEPLSSIDEQLKDKVLSFIQRVLAEWQIPVLYVTHDANELNRMATHVVRIQDGRITDAPDRPGCAAERKE